MVRTHLLAASAVLLLPAASVLAQTESEVEELVFVDVVGRSVQLPLSFAAAVCGLGTDQVASDFGGTTDAVCEVDEAAAAQMGLADESGEMVDLGPQDFVNVQLPDNETRVQLPKGLAARLCQVEESELTDDSSSVRLVGCELTQEQVDASGLPGLLAGQDEGEGESTGG